MVIQVYTSLKTTKDPVHNFVCIYVKKNHNEHFYFYSFKLNWIHLFDKLCSIYTKELSFVFIRMLFLIASHSNDDKDVLNFYYIHLYLNKMSQ